MADNRRYFVVTEKAVPDVLLKVVEAKRLLDIQKSATVQEAVDEVGISRSSFYKYKDDIFPFKEKTRGQNITFIIQMDDEPGLLSAVLGMIAKFHGRYIDHSSKYSYEWDCNFDPQCDHCGNTGRCSCYGGAY